MTRVALPTAREAPILARPYAPEDPVDPLVAALSQVPELLEAAMPFIGALFGPSQISMRTKELVILRSSALLGCVYCTGLHSLAALDLDLTREQVLALRAEGAGARWDGRFEDVADRALLGWVDAVAVGRGPVEAVRFEGVREHFAEHELVELTMLAGCTVMLNRFCTSLELPSSAETLSRLVEERLL